MRLHCLALCLISGVASAQTPDTTLQHLQKIPDAYAAKVEAKAASVNAAITKKEAEYVDKLSKIEARILAKLQKIDPSRLTALAPSSYDSWLSKAGVAPTSYVPSLDTMKTSLSFLQQSSAGSAVSGSSAVSGALSGASTQVAQLQGNLNQSALIDQYIQQRRAQLSALLAQYTNLPASVTNTFNQYKEEAYYYRAQIQAYKDELNDPDKMMATAQQVLNKVPAYQSFLSRNSFLAGLFAAPPGGGGTAPGSLPLNLGNLQTRTLVQGFIQQQLAPGGQSAVQSAQQQMQAAQGQLNSLQNQISKFGSSGGGSDMDLPPGFQPNTQKTKTFLKRIEYGANVQFAQSTYSFPATANVALSLGYKINDKSTIGVGLAYLAGMGTGWGHIQFSNQGIGFRSSMDWKIKKTYYVIGGFEENYMTQFSSIAVLRNVAWQKSALIGLERKYKINSKLKGNVQVLFDALYKQEIPQGQMIKFRVGYNF